MYCVMSMRGIVYTIRNIQSKFKFSGKFTSPYNRSNSVSNFNQNTRDIHSRSFGFNAQTNVINVPSNVETSSHLDALPEVQMDSSPILGKFIDIYNDINEEFRSVTDNPELLSIISYYADGQGKAIRPLLAAYVGKSLNFHLSDGICARLSDAQWKIATAIEMIHIASLLHDDLIDRGISRRGKASVVNLNHHKVARAGNFVCGLVLKLASSLGHDDVTWAVAQISADLVRGELAQIGGFFPVEGDAFSRYLDVTYCKAASLFSYSSKAMALLSGADHSLCESAFNYGRNIGMAFQMTDDVLDIEEDMKLGIATAPVLLACGKYPELMRLVERKFRGDDDVQRALEFVHEAKSLEETKDMVLRYCVDAVRQMEHLQDSPYKEALAAVGSMVYSRIRTL